MADGRGQNAKGPPGTAEGLTSAVATPNYVLVLNASYEFLNVATLERAVKLIYKGKAEILESIAVSTVP